MARSHRWSRAGRSGRSSGGWGGSQWGYGEDFEGYGHETERGRWGSHRYERGLPEWAEGRTARGWGSRFGWRRGAERFEREPVRGGYGYEGTFDIGRSSEWWGRGGMEHGGEYGRRRYGGARSRRGRFGTRGRSRVGRPGYGEEFGRGYPW